MSTQMTPQKGAQCAVSTTDDGRPRGAPEPSWVDSVDEQLMMRDAACGGCGRRTRVCGGTEAADPRSQLVTTVEEISTLTRPNHPDDWTDLDSSAVDTVRVLAADAVHKVGNGHPGTAMSL